MPLCCRSSGSSSSRLESFQIIEAHGFARSYGIEMRKILDLKIELQRLDNEIVSGMYRADREAEGTSRATVGVVVRWRSARSRDSGPIYLYLTFPLKTATAQPPALTHIGLNGGLERST